MQEGALASQACLNHSVLTSEGAQAAKAFSLAAQSCPHSGAGGLRFASVAQPSSNCDSETKNAFCKSCKDIQPEQYFFLHANFFFNYLCINNFLTPNVNPKCLHF